MIFLAIPQAFTIRHVEGSSREGVSTEEKISLSACLEYIIVTQGDPLLVLDRSYVCRALISFRSDGMGVN